MVRACLIALVALFALSCAGDARPRTELMLVADTDIPHVQSIRFDISDGTRDASATAALSSAKPATLGLVPQGNALGPVTVSATALRDGVELARRWAVVSFVPRETRVVALHLAASCSAVQCGTDSPVCTERGCAAEALSESDLPAWQGEAPTLSSPLGDAGSEMDAGDDAAAPTEDGAPPAGDAGADAESLADCGPAADGGVDLQTNPSHCGACGNKCKPAPHASPVCRAGGCALECKPPYGDCDRDPNNGCELLLNVDAHCGACDRSCGDATSCRFGMCR